MSNPLKYLVLILYVSIFFSCKSDEPVAVQPVTEVQTQKQKSTPNHALQIPGDEIPLKENQTLQPIDKPDFYDGKAAYIVEQPVSYSAEYRDLNRMPIWKRERVKTLRTERLSIQNTGVKDAAEIKNKPLAERKAWLKQWNQQNQAKIKELYKEEQATIKSTTLPKPSDTEISSLLEEVSSDSPQFHEKDVYTLAHILKQKMAEAKAQQINLNNDREYSELLQVMMILSRMYSTDLDLRELYQPL